MRRGPNRHPPWVHRVASFVFALLMCACPLLASSRVFSVQPPIPPAIERLLQQDEITILVTDSGLGGLSVAAELENGFRSARAFRRVNLVFANALPDVDRTYNAMTTRKEQVDTFDLALQGMTRWYKPDLILVACNTLSVLIPETRFARSGRVPILGIIDSGVRAMSERLKADPSAVALLLGTPITIGSGVHRARLLALGFERDQVQEQACPNLETEIQADPGSDIVRGLIEAYGDEARRALAARATRPLIVGLCCTHYGYSLALFQEVLDQQFGRHVVVVNPNIEMSRSVLARVRRGAFGATETSVRVVSRAAITAQEREAIAAVLARWSPKTAAGLRSYDRKMDLFDALR